MKFKWNDENTQEAVDRYAESDKSIKALKEIADALDTSHRSVIGKLVHTGDYQVQDTSVSKKPKDEGPTKKEILNDLRARDFNADGFEGATKDALNRLSVLVA